MVCGGHRPEAIDKQVHSAFFGVDLCHPAPRLTVVHRRCPARQQDRLLKDLHVHDNDANGARRGFGRALRPLNQTPCVTFSSVGREELLHQDQSCCCRSPGEKACVDLVSWHADDMAGKEIDPIRAKSALAVIKQNPGIALFALSPALILLGVIWWLAGAGWAIAAAVVLVLLGGAAVVLKR